MDIVFGLEVSIGNIHYGLPCVDHFVRMTFVYPLHNLTPDIPKQMETFLAHFGMVPECHIFDFDMKMIGSRAHAFKTVFWFL
jgi:hypothetical protein